MAEKTQWHPLLVQFLRHGYKGKFSIKEAFKPGEMPLEVDMLIKLLVPLESLPYPFNHLGETTFVEFKGAGDTVTWEAISQIEGYACLYQRREKIKDRREITLWVIASKFAENFNQFPCRYIDNLTPVGEGVKRGNLLLFPIYLIDLGELPITIPTIPLLLVYKGHIEREKKIVKFFIKHYHEISSEYRYFMQILHTKALKEVLEEMEMDIDIESLRDFDFDLPAIIDLQKTISELTGQEDIFEEKVLKALFPKSSTEQIRKIIELAERSQSD